MTYNVIYIGSSGRGCDYINCHSEYNVVGVICQRSMIDEELLTCCYLRDVPIFEINNYSGLKQALEQNRNKFDFAIMFIFGMILKEDILDNFNVYNIHLGFLPGYKGRNSTFHATMRGEKRVGISLHKAVLKIDEGEIISRKSVPYYFWMGEMALRQSAAEQIPNLLTDLARYMEDPDYQTIANNSESYYPPITASMLEINEYTPVKDVMNIIRSQDFYHGGRFIYGGATYLIKEAKVSLFNTADPDLVETSDRIILKNGRPFGIRINDSHYLQFKIDRIANFI